MSSENESAQRRAVVIVADTVGELMRFWNFKPSMGRIWAVLYLSHRPLDAAEIEERAVLSAGSVSMTLTELIHWGVIQRVPGGDGRRRTYIAETDIWALVARVFREREVHLVERTVAQLEEALRLIDEARGSEIPAMLENRFLATRIRRLADLARQGRRLVARLGQTGSADLGAIRGVLQRAGGER